MSSKKSIISMRANEYRKNHKDRYRIHSMKYYTAHRDEINRKKREQYKQKSLTLTPEQREERNRKRRELYARQKLAKLKAHEVKELNPEESRPLMN